MSRRRNSQRPDDQRAVLRELSLRSANGHKPAAPPIEKQHTHRIWCSCGFYTFTARGFERHLEMVSRGEWQPKGRFAT